MAANDTVLQFLEEVTKIDSEKRSLELRLANLRNEHSKLSEKKIELHQADLSLEKEEQDLINTMYTAAEMCDEGKRGVDAETVAMHAWVAEAKLLEGAITSEISSVNKASEDALKLRDTYQ